MHAKNISRKEPPSHEKPLSSSDYFTPTRRVKQGEKPVRRSAPEVLAGKDNLTILDNRLVNNGPLLEISSNKSELIEQRNNILHELDTIGQKLKAVNQQLAPFTYEAEAKSANENITNRLEKKNYSNKYSHKGTDAKEEAPEAQPNLSEIDISQLELERQSLQNDLNAKIFELQRIDAILQHHRYTHGNLFDKLEHATGLPFDVFENSLEWAKRTIGATLDGLLPKEGELS